MRIIYYHCPIRQDLIASISGALPLSNGQGQATPIGRTIRLIGDAWILLIIINLLRGPKRFNELQAFMGHISSKTLTQRLRALQELGFVQRRAFLEIPPRVEYHLTDKGQEFGEVIAAIEQFAQRNLSGLIEAVTAAEPRYDQRTQE